MKYEIPSNFILVLLSTIIYTLRTCSVSDVHVKLHSRYDFMIPFYISYLQLIISHRYASVCNVDYVILCHMDNYFS